MDPSQPPVQPSPQLPVQPPASSSVDYLNHIAPAVAPKQHFSKIQLIIGGVLGGLLVLVIGLSLFFNLTKTPSPAQTLAARLITTEKIVNSAKPLLKSTQLRVLNSNLTIYLADVNRRIAEPLLNVKIDVTKLDKTIVAREAATELIAKLDDARLNATYDRIYALEMTYQLKTIMTLMQKIYTTTSNTSLKTFLEDAYKNLKPTQEAFDAFNAVNG